MAEQITLRKGNHTVTTTVPREAYNLEARGYTRDTKQTRSAPAPAEKKSDKK